MLINADFSQRATLASEQQQWVASPQNGVERVMLDRIGEEKARATSLVRYAPNSHFPHHLHPSGEEILVLSGTFSADDDDYPTGWYLRNPPKSGHKPHSREGAVIFVKLRQMPASEKYHVAINTNDEINWQLEGARMVCPLFTDDNERVSLQRLNANEQLFTDTIHGGAEVLILAGELIENSESYQRNSWLRLPIDAQSSIVAGEQGATVYLKTGHLLSVIGADITGL